MILCGGTFSATYWHRQYTNILFRKRKATECSEATQKIGKKIAYREMRCFDCPETLYKRAPLWLAELMDWLTLCYAVISFEVGAPVVWCPQKGRRLDRRMRWWEVMKDHTSHCTGGCNNSIGKWLRARKLIESGVAKYLNQGPTPSADPLGLIAFVFTLDNRGPGGRAVHTAPVRPKYRLRLLTLKPGFMGEIVPEARHTPSTRPSQLL